MLGTILYVDDATRMAVVRAEDGKRYTFALGELPAGVAMVAGDRVDFDIEAGRAVSPMPYVAVDVDAAAASAEVPSALSPNAQSSDALPPNEAPLPIAEEAPVVPSPLTQAPPPTGFQDAGPTLARGTDERPTDVTPVPGFNSLPGSPADDAWANTSFNSAPIGDADPLPGMAAGAPEYRPAGTPAATDDSRQTRTLWLVVGGIFAAIILALAYMMWDNRSAAGTEPAVVEPSDTPQAVQIVRFTLRAITIRSEASATGGTALGELVRGARVTGVEVPGATDPNTRWLRIDNSDRFVPLASVGSIAPPTLTQTFNVPMTSIGTLAIHDQPADAARVVQTLTVGQPFHLFGQTATGWAEIGLPDGSVGYTNLGASQWAAVGGNVRNAVGVGVTTGDPQPIGPAVGGKIVGPSAGSGPAISGPAPQPAPRRIEPAPPRPSPPPRRSPAPEPDGGSGQSSQGGDAGGPSKPE